MEELSHSCGLNIAAPRAWSFVSVFSRLFLLGSNPNHTLSLESLQISVLKGMARMEWLLWKLEAGNA